MHTTSTRRNHPSDNSLPIPSNYFFLYSYIERTLIYITEAQKSSFAGNMLQVVNADGEKIMVMSTQAYKSLNAGQISTIEKANRIVHSSLETIETLGGGSARCMMAEVFLPRE